MFRATLGRDRMTGTLQRRYNALQRSVIKENMALTPQTVTGLDCSKRGRGRLSLPEANYRVGWKFI